MKSLLTMIMFGMVSIPLFASTPVDPIHQFDSLIIGKWTGDLEYRDYSSNKMVDLPTTVDITHTKTPGSVSLAFVFDDGPQKIVTDTLVIAIDAKKSSATFTDGGDPPQAYKASGLSRFGSTRTLTFRCEGTDNDQPAEIREMVHLSDKTFDYLREVAPKGTSKYEFRHEYKFNRTSGSPSTP